MLLRTGRRVGKEQADRPPGTGFKQNAVPSGTDVGERAGFRQSRDGTVHACDAICEAGRTDRVFRSRVFDDETGGEGVSAAGSVD